ncbi:MAG: GNAT family N-acetyltransferase [Chloroflexota bacterium]|nr:GNAT family N-acetyltransferase [Chloroflexota bacterium]
MEIRRLRPADTNDLVALLTESFAEEISLSGIGAGSVRGQVRSAIAANRPPDSLLLRAGGSVLEIWVAVEGDKILGSYGLHGTSPLHISTVAVRPERRGRGIGRALMEHALERARGLGAKQVVLEVLAHNEAAVKLYRSLGMQEYDRRRTYARRLPREHRAPPVHPRIELSPVRRAHYARWEEVLRASVPAEAWSFSELYRSEYLSNTVTRWFEERVGPARTTRRVVLLDGCVAGFLRVRSAPGQPLADIAAPLYLPELGPYMADLIQAAEGLLNRSDRPLCRLYVSEDRPEGWMAATELGYEFERSWLYMYRNI